MQWIEAQYRVVTPMFLGGANQAAEFRLASYVNVVRWWWRFLALGRYGDKHIASFWEAVLFGWVGEPFGRKRVSFRLAGPLVTEGAAKWASSSDLKANSGLNYLSVQGLSDRDPCDVAEFAIHARVSQRVLKIDPGWSSKDDPVSATIKMRRPAGVHRREGEARREAHASRQTHCQRRSKNLPLGRSKSRPFYLTVA